MLVSSFFLRIDLAAIGIVDVSLVPCWSVVSSMIDTAVDDGRCSCWLVCCRQ